MLKSCQGKLRKFHKNIDNFLPLHKICFIVFYVCDVRILL